MDNASRDQNSVPTILGVSNVDGKTPVRIYADPVTHRLLVDIAGGGTVTDVSVVTANGFAGTVADSTTTPEITIETTVTGLVKGDGTAITAAVANTDYQVPIILTTTGTSGASTFDGTTLNIPNYTGSTGDVTGPASSTDNAIVRFDGATGKVIQNSTIIGSDAGDLTVPGGIRVGFAGTGDDDEIQVGDANFALDYGSGSIPTLFFDGSDGLSYARATNEYDFLIAAAPVMTVAATSVQPGASDGSSLGIGTAAWSDLFLASGGVINWNNGNYTLTHTAGLLTANGAFSVGTSNSITTGTIELGAATDTTLSRSAAGVLAVEGVVIPSISSTNTLTNKRVTPRLTTTNAPGATPTTNSDNVDIMNFTGLAANITSMTTNLSGTPTDGQKLEFRFTDNGTPRTIAWGASFGSTTVTLPTTTVASTMLRVGFEWNGTIWQCIATA